jgi:Nucleotidyl transferase AbiEii toxin, Type IV TA system
MKFKPPDAPPLRPSHLERLVVDYSTANSVPVARVRHWISTMVVIGALSRESDDAASRRFLVKGGVALEVRLGLSARATKDLDLIFRGVMDELEPTLERLLGDEYCGFTFRIAQPKRIRETDSYRFEIALAFRGKGWGKLQIEVSPPEGRAVEEVDLVESIDISHFLGDSSAPRLVACLSLRYQIATKLHAMTERFSDGSQNGRSRDLIDLLLLRELVDDPFAVAAACEEIFRARAKQEWPPSFEPELIWATTYPLEAEQLGFELSLDQAVAEVRNFIAALATSTDAS